MIREHINKSYHRILLEKLIKENSPLINGNILDIGSKNRRYDHLFKGKIHAIDKKPEREDVEEGDIEKGLRYKNEEFDNILCIEVFEYLKNYEKAIEEIHRLLKDEGNVFISIPFVYSDHGDNMRFTKEFIVERMEKHFFEVNFMPIGNGFVVIWDILRKKVFKIKLKLIRYFLFLFILPILLIIKVLKLWKIKDNYYSGVFLILKK